LRSTRHYPRLGAASQRLRRYGGLGAVVLTPVQEDLARADRSLHGGGDQTRGLLLQGPGDLFGDLVGARGRDGLVETGVEVDALGAAGHREGLEACVGEQVPEIGRASCRERV